jgi:molybdate transport system substrate-binding protein
MGRLGRAAVRSVLTALAAGWFAAGACAAELRVAAPNAVKESVSEIAARFERDTGHRVVFAWTGSEAITRRVSEGEAFDVVLNVDRNVDRLTADGRLVPGSRVDFARSGIGVAVRSGLPRPDVSTVDALRQTVLDARSVAISSGASGRYLESLFQRLGIWEQVRAKAMQPPSGAQIGELLARGDADLGFQQVTELLHASGIDYLGPLPAAVQHDTVWSAGVHRGCAAPDVCRAFVQALAAPESSGAIRRTGLEPARAAR